MLFRSKPAIELELAVEQQPERSERIQSIGRLGWRDGFREIWLGEEHYDLRRRPKARLCIEYPVAQKAFNADSAQHLVKEIDPYVREKGDYLQSAAIKIDHYFYDRKGRLPRLRKELIPATARRNGKFYLKTD